MVEDLIGVVVQGGEHVSGQVSALEIEALEPAPIVEVDVGPPLIQPRHMVLLNECTAPLAHSERAFELSDDGRARYLIEVDKRPFFDQMPDGLFRQAIAARYDIAILLVDAAAKVGQFALKMHQAQPFDFR